MEMKILRLIICLSTVFFAGSCAKDIVDLTGDIQGTVKDYDSGSLLENCRVSLSPGGKSAATDANGAFSFDDLEAGTYTLSFSKSGYGDETQEVSVVTGQTSKVNVYLKLPSATSGKIAGTIKDYQNGQLISNCKVSLTPTGKSVTSSSSGTYEFEDLTPGQYSVSFTKAGYDDENTTVTVTAGKTTTADALLKAKASFALSETSYDFGDLEVSKTFYFFNYSDTDCSFSILNVPAWLSFDKTSGTVKASGNEAVTAFVDRDKVSEGSYSQNITISYSGKESGSASLSIKMKKVVLTAPSVSIASSAENIKENSFDISGSITATGGSQITNYGHCWNTTGNPTINDNKTDLGTTDAILTFKSTAENLTTYTTYYVRAYAKNAQGIAYSDAIAVTTQNVASDKWDGNIASSFASGSGTYINPYIIKTGGQLLLAKNYSDKYFELGGNIDLDNKNWLPYSFKGNLDGKGYTISNLYVDREDDKQGLFSECAGVVSNLTINGVSINAENKSYIGAISGSGGTIKNCKVILGGSSILVGMDFVGGISGLNASISGCVVESSKSSAVIIGNKYVGGIVGYQSSNNRFQVSDTDYNIDNSSVKCVIHGGRYVGGIIGYNEANSLQNSSFEGTITGEDEVGGLIGQAVYYGGQLKGCKSNADITSNGDAGGLIGYIWNATVEIFGCYANGTISAKRAYGLTSSGANAHLSYSTMTSTSSSFYGLGVSGEDCATTSSVASGSDNCKNFKASCTDITTFLKESYSEYSSYWNFNSTWVWEGTINGSTARVSCPKLAWE